MPNVSSFGAQTVNAVVSGTVTDRQMIIPEVPPQGLMSVGPRQSPNYIKDPWNAQISYVFYDVVKDGAGASYVATKPVVPAGTALTDENYWFKWSDPNAQIDELNEVVKTFNKRIEQNASAITAEVARATAAEEAEEQRATAAEVTKAPINHASEETIYGVGNEVNYGHVRLAADDTPMTSDANAGTAATPKMILRVRNLKRNRPTLALYIGNSYTDGIGSTTQHDGIYSLTHDMFDDSYVFTSGGAGFSSYEGQSGEKNFGELVQDAISSSKFNPEDVTHVIFVGAWGETELLEEKNFNGFEMIKTAINNVSKTCTKAFSNLERMCYYWAEARQEPYINNNLYWEFAVHNLAPLLFDSSEIEYIGWGGWDLLYNPAYFSNDKYHPNDAGYRLLSNNFKRAFNGNLHYMPFGKNFTGQDVTPFIQNGTLDYEIVLYPDRTIFNLGQLKQTSVPSTYTSAASNTWTKLFSSTKEFGFPAPPTNLSVDIKPCIYYVSDFTFDEPNRTATLPYLYGIKSTETSSEFDVYAFTKLNGTKSNNSFSGVTYFSNGSIEIPFERVSMRV